MIEFRASPEERIQQGDIVRNVEYLERIVTYDNGMLEIDKIVFPSVFVLTQDCDLQQGIQSQNKEDDKQKNALIISVLVAPMYNSEHFRLGEHLEYLNAKTQTYPSSRTNWKSIIQNSNPRYHFLEFGADIPLVNSIIDFKQYFSVSLKTIQDNKSGGFVGSVGDLYREDVCQRFSAYLSRIGLPNPTV